MGWGRVYMTFCGFAFVFVSVLDQNISSRDSETKTCNGNCIYLPITLSERIYCEEKVYFNFLYYVKYKIYLILYSITLSYIVNTGCGKGRFTVVYIENNTILNNNTRISSILCTHNCKLTFAHTYKN